MQQTFPTLPGNWEIIEKIGSGSYGTVYRAKRTVGSYTEWAAVKHISIPKSEDELRAIYDELGTTESGTIGKYLSGACDSLVEEYRQMSAFRGHTNIVACNDIQIVEKPDSPGYDMYIWMELLTSLSGRIMEGRMDREETIRLGIDICNALERMESKSVVHRDVKPQNIFFNEEGDYKLGDFGAARRIQGTSTFLSIKGTYAYLPPEVLLGRPANFTTDIYSLGMVLYRLMNGNLMPFMEPGQEADSLVRDTANVRRFGGEELPPPVNADPALAQVILKACAYKPEDRWQTAKEMRDALKRLRAGDAPLEVVRPLPHAEETASSQKEEPEVQQPTSPDPQPVPVPEAPETEKPKGSSKSSIIVLMLLILLFIGAVILAQSTTDKEVTSANLAGSAPAAWDVSATYNNQTGEIRLTWSGNASAWTVRYGCLGEDFKFASTSSNTIVLANLKNEVNYAFYIYPEGENYDSPTSLHYICTIPAAASPTPYVTATPTPTPTATPTPTPAPTEVSTLTHEFEIRYNGNGCTIERYIGNDEYLVIPNIINGFTVTEIGNQAFKGCKSLSYVNIPDGVMRIGIQAFMDCISLKSVSIPDSVEMIGSSAFEGCSSLLSASIPSGVGIIWASTFENCVSLESVTIPYGVHTIGAFAFNGCTALSSVYIPDSVKQIGHFPFSEYTLVIVKPNSYAYEWAKENAFSFLAN